MTARRFPFALPFGWFSVGRIDELPAEPVNTQRLFGREPVLWEDGEHPHLVDLTCSHIGAHLGVGGLVEASSPPGGNQFSPTAPGSSPGRPQGCETRRSV